MHFRRERGGSEGRGDGWCSAHGLVLVHPHGGGSGKSDGTWNGRIIEEGIPSAGSRHGKSDNPVTAARTLSGVHIDAGIANGRDDRTATVTTTGHNLVRRTHV